jgi:hypothetical protein
MLFPMLTAAWLHLVLYFSTEYHKSRQDVLILFWKYLIDIRSQAWLNIYVDKWKTVCSVGWN